MADTVHTRFVFEAVDAYLDAETIKVLLTDANYTPNVDDDYASTPAADELSDGSYARKTASIAVTLDDANDRVDIEFDANIVWSSIDAGTIGHATFYREGASDAASELISSHAIDKATNGGDFTLTAGDIIRITSS